MNFIPSTLLIITAKSSKETENISGAPIATNRIGFIYKNRIYKALKIVFRMAQRSHGQPSSTVYRERALQVASSPAYIVFAAAKYPAK